MLWYGMSKVEVLEQVYPDEIDSMLVKARKFRATRLAEDLRVVHTNNAPELMQELMGVSEVEEKKESFSEGLARLAEIRANLGTKQVGDPILARRIRLHGIALEYLRGNRGTTDS